MLVFLAILLAPFLFKIYLFIIMGNYFEIDFFFRIFPLIFQEFLKQDLISKQFFFFS